MLALIIKSIIPTNQNSLRNYEPTERNKMRENGYEQFEKTAKKVEKMRWL